jgi:hypothetical protein
LKNPWGTKNPMLSFWLSGANAMLGSARGHAMSSARRQSQAMMAEGARQWVSLWTGGLAGKPTRTRRKRR